MDGLLTSTLKGFKPLTERKIDVQLDTYKNYEIMGNRILKLK